MRGRACATAPRRSGRAGAGANAAAAGRGGAGRRDHRGDRPGASTRGRPARPGEACSIRLAQRGPRDRERIDRFDLPRVRPARRSGTVSFGDPHRDLRRRRAAPVPASGSAGGSSTAQSRSSASPLTQPSSSSLPTQITFSSSSFVDSHRGHRLLVYVQSDHDHLHRLQAVGGDRRADRPQSRVLRPEGVWVLKRCGAMPRRSVLWRCYVVTLSLPFMPVAKWTSHW